MIDAQAATLSQPKRVKWPVPISMTNQAVGQLNYNDVNHRFVKYKHFDVDVFFNLQAQVANR